MEPVFSYKVQINDKTDSIVALAKLKKLEEEEPQLKVFFNEQLKEININKDKPKIMINMLKQLYGLWRIF